MKNPSSDIIGPIPAISGNELMARRSADHKERYAQLSNIDLKKVQAAFGIALHMHQPVIPAEHDNVRSARLISNLKYMMEHQHIGDNHNAPVFLWCYSRIADFIKELVAAGRNPRVMLDYSGCLLWGLAQMGEEKVLDNLRQVTSDERYFRNVEWLGTMWGHAVVTSTPIPDIPLHIAAWQEHFLSLFGHDALERVKGFSPPEMHLPIHPDVCYEYVKQLKRFGYEWLMVQEHTIEHTDGTPLKRPYFPHRLVAKNSLGNIEEIPVLIKTQGSDTKLVAQMQPYYEAQSKQRESFNGVDLPPYCLQIADGENGGVMMNEFPPKFNEAFNEIGTTGVVAMNGSEYLEMVRRTGLKNAQFTPVQPISQHIVWEHITEYGKGSCDRAIESIHKAHPQFSLDKGSWTNDRNWVKGYEHILDPINRLSADFHSHFDGVTVDTKSHSYQKALLHLLLSQTSCFRYWGGGLWTEYAKEICRRGEESLKNG